MLIAAFNVKRLGRAKINNPDVLKNLIKIVSRYSVVVMLEVVDQSGEAMEMFLEELNDFRPNRNNQYSMICSESLGRGTYREQFVFFYREDEATIINQYQYEEEGNVDVLVREPFIVQFNCPNTVVQNLVLIPVHTKPEDAETELSALHDVVQDAIRKMKTKNIMILGDFNADGPYFPEARRGNIRLGKPPYHWLIDDDVDTTTSDNNDRTYDRIVVYGDQMKRAVVTNSAQPFDFKTTFRLSAVAAAAVSDHYPVEVELKERR
ncbi:deoxyribonuclease-1-like 1 [Centropristis striata]|uniref:deoxyribonuclease-1-like 1 n=1 Tax=Centropristis striata TaxID=184440 RepID=UPI0027E0FFE0|nr:deoxyribonuclease-1-like 1 [Centropristis striata]XP_059184062.1 deoxyribonuclease-1-like 1 [Centropristis striata]